MSSILMANFSSAASGETASSLSVEGSNGRVQEVLYDEAVTPLFVAVQEADWGKAYKLIEKSPSDTRTWVKSTGTENTTFGWSTWRRLPIHEACRRQAPAWLISALLDVFPESAAEKTLFGELPLHLAVECGAAPEVVNLLVVANWKGIADRDKSGRTPLEILQSSETILEEDDQKVVYQSLKRCSDTYQCLQEEFRRRLEEKNRVHEATMFAVKEDHEKSLREKQSELKLAELEVVKLRAHGDALREELTKKDRKIANLREEEKKWVARLDAKDSELVQVEREDSEKQKKIDHLYEELRKRDKAIVERDNYIRVLSRDLIGISKHCDLAVNKSLERAEISLRALLESHMGLAELLRAQRGSVHRLVEARGLATFESVSLQRPPSEPKSLAETKIESQEATRAVGAAVAAATVALEASDSK